jgi:glycosyltransferase involved in cell wall biosynthesis
MKNKMLEAMAMGKAIVTTPAGTSGIAAKPGQEYLVAEEPAAFAEAVLGLLADREKRRRLAQASRVFVEKHYTWERMAESYESVYLQVTAAGRLDAQSPEDK